MELEQNQFDFWNLHGRISLETKFGHYIRAKNPMKPRLAFIQFGRCNFLNYNGKNG